MRDFSTQKYGLIGDMHRLAMVGRHGAIDFCAMPEIDSSTVFGALLDAGKGGTFVLAPTSADIAANQTYVDDTNILVTRFEGPGFRADVVDFFTLNHGHAGFNLVRMVRGVQGEAPFHMLCAPRFDYARAAHRIEKNGDDILFSSRGRDGLMLRLKADLPLEISDADGVATFDVRPGTVHAFCLTDAASLSGSSEWDASVADGLLHTTTTLWREWIARAHYEGHGQSAVRRALLVLRLLFSEQYGSLAGAATLGLPQVLGGARNWDYRHARIRDAAFAVSIFLRTGLEDEAFKSLRWLEARALSANADGSLKPLYRMNGNPELLNELLPHLAGHKGSTPVRVGAERQAAAETQLDLPGSMVDALYLFNKYVEPISYDLWMSVVRLVDWVCFNWRHKDESLWEIRTTKHTFLHSRVLCWVALDRAIRIAMRRSFPAPLERWQRIRDEIFQTIFTNFWQPKRGAFVQHKSAQVLDAACLLMPMFKFVSPTDPRWLSTLTAIETELGNGPLVKRYLINRPDLGTLPGSPNYSVAASFWRVECLARAGRWKDAQGLFDALIKVGEPTQGVFPQEIADNGDFMGNTPHALAHLSLVSAALAVQKSRVRAKRALHRPSIY